MRSLVAWRRAPSTVSRELRRNAATRSGGFDYRATTAQWHADRAACRPKSARLAVHAALHAYVEDRLAGVVVAPDGAAINVFYTVLRLDWAYAVNRPDKRSVFSLGFGPSF